MEFVAMFPFLYSCNAHLFILVLYSLFPKLPLMTRVGRIGISYSKVRVPTQS